VPLNAACLERESNEFAFVGFNDVAFDRINDQFQAVIQEPADTLLSTRSPTRGLFTSMVKPSA
jgi:hypothetical protein